MSGWYVVKCAVCGFEEKRYRNVKKCRKCRNDVQRVVKSRARVERAGGERVKNKSFKPVAYRFFQFVDELMHYTGIGYGTNWARRFCYWANGFSSSPDPDGGK